MPSSPYFRMDQFISLRFLMHEFFRDHVPVHERSSLRHRTHTLLIAVLGLFSKLQGALHAESVDTQRTLMKEEAFARIGKVVRSFESDVLAAPRNVVGAKRSAILERSVDAHEIKLVKDLFFQLDDALEHTEFPGCSGSGGTGASAGGAATKDDKEGGESNGDQFGFDRDVEIDGAQERDDGMDWIDGDLKVSREVGMKAWKRELDVARRAEEEVDKMLAIERRWPSSLTDAEDGRERVDGAEGGSDGDDVQGGGEKRSGGIGSDGDSAAAGGDSASSHAASLVCPCWFTWGETVDDTWEQYAKSGLSATGRNAAEAKETVAFRRQTNSLPQPFTPGSDLPGFQPKDIRFRVRQIACMEFYAFACLDSGELLQICTKTKMRARLQPDSDEPATTARGGTVPVANLVPFGSYREVRILQIACGRQHICAIDRKGRIFAWWGNKLGQCGTGKRSVKPIKSPRQIKRFGVGELMRTADTMKIVHVSCGNNNSFVVTQDGYVYSWGEGTHGQLGRDVDIAIEAKPPKQAKGGPTQGDIGGVYTPTPMRCFAIEKLIRNSGPTQVHAQSGLRDRVLYRRLMLVGGHDYAMAWFSSDDSLHTIMGGKSLSSGVEGAGGTVASTPLCSRCLHFEGDNASLKSEKQQIEVNALHLKAELERLTDTMKVRDEELAESRKEATDRGTTTVRLPVSVTMHRARALVGAIEDTEAELLQWKLTYSRGIIASGHEVTRRDREAEKIKANFETAQYNIQKLRQENTVLTNEMSRLREQKRSLNSQLARNSTAMSSGDQEGAIYDIENEMRLKQTLIDRNERFIEVAMSQIQTTGNAHVDLMHSTNTLRSGSATSKERLATLDGASLLLRQLRSAAITQIDELSSTQSGGRGSSDLVRILASLRGDLTSAQFSAISAKSHDVKAMGLRQILQQSDARINRVANRAEVVLRSFASSEDFDEKIAAELLKLIMLSCTANRAVNDQIRAGITRAQT